MEDEISKFKWLILERQIDGMKANNNDELGM